MDSAGIANQIYHLLLENGIDVLFDDRDVSPGVKFNDADLIGIPIRLTVSERAMANGGVEFKLRHQPQKNIIALDLILPYIHSQITALKLEISTNQKSLELPPID